MKESGKPVPKNLEKTTAMARALTGNGQQPLDLSDTRTAFAHKNDAELRQTAWLFRMMNKPWLVHILSSIGLLAVRWRLPFAETIVKRTIYRQFVGGTTLLESVPAIERLRQHGVQSVLDYGAEGKETEEDFNKTMRECLRAVEFASQSESVPVVSTKLTGLGRFSLLESIQRGEAFTRETREEYKSVLKRIDAICNLACKRGVMIYIDAEESWIQDTIDHLVTIMMRRYNRERVIVYNTFQMYRHDRLQFLIDSYNQARKGGYHFGAKLVRGAYMDKERERAEAMGYASPIYPTKEATDDAFNTAIRFCLDHYETMSVCNASHNQLSALLQHNLISERKLPRRHPNIWFCQLYGMSDNVTFNLAHSGYNVAKYVPYGPVREVVPYLVRRAQENTSVTGDMSREYELVMREVQRRAKAK